MPAYILGKLCRGCKRCINACPEEAIALKGSLAVVDPNKCVECESCLDSCMHGAITFQCDAKSCGRPPRIASEPNQEQLVAKLEELEEKWQDLLGRWPAHSVKPVMIAQREALEEERDRLKQAIEKQQEDCHETEQM